MEHATESQRGLLASHLRELRLARNWTLEQLADHSGISRASLSRIENGEVSPTAETLGLLASAFSIPISQVLLPLESRFTQLVRSADQPVWKSAEGGFRRRNVSPPSQALKGEVIWCRLEPHQSVNYPRPPEPGREHHLILLSGKLSVKLGEVQHDLTPNDCLRYHLSGPSTFTTGSKAADYMVALV